MNKNKNGFVSMTLVYTFLIVFLFLMLAILNTYNTKNKYIEAIDNKVNDDIKVNRESKDGILNKLISDNTPSYAGNIKYHLIANLSEGNSNGFYYSKDSYLDENGDSNVLNTIYFFRGEVNNNYLLMKDKNNTNLCFRILRTDENGNVRLVYSGTALSGNKCSETGAGGITVDGESSFIFNNVIGTEHKINEVKFMLAEPGEELSIASQSSYAKNRLDKWFVDHFAGDVKIVDAQYCNSTHPYYSLNESFDSLHPEVLTPVTYYNAHNYNVVMADENNQNYYADNEMFYNGFKFKMECVADTTSGSSQSEKYEDRYTLSTYVNGNNHLGNQLLSNPVGLLTIEDVILAGGRIDTANTNYYLSRGVDYWTMTPYSYDSENGGRMVYVAGDGSIKYDSVAIRKAIVPVITITKSARVASGTGAWDNPYVLK